MFSNKAVCNGLKAGRVYKKTNQVCFSRQNVIDEENGRDISFRLCIRYNKKTDIYSVSSALVYGRCYIGPLKTGKRNCNDPGFVKKYSETNLKSVKKYSLKKHDQVVDDVL